MPARPYTTSTSGRRTSRWLTRRRWATRGWVWITRPIRRPTPSRSRQGRRTSSPSRSTSRGPCCSPATNPATTTVGWSAPSACRRAPLLARSVAPILRAPGGAMTPAPPKPTGATRGGLSARQVDGGIPPQGILQTGKAHRDRGGGSMAGYSMNKKDLQDRLRRIEGQLRGIQRMVDQDQYCIDILTQLNSASAALKAVGMGLLDEHVRHCVKDSIDQGNSDEKVEELLAAVARFSGK